MNVIRLRMMSLGAANGHAALIVLTQSNSFTALSTLKVNSNYY